MGFCQAFIGSLIILIPLCTLTIFYIWYQNELDSLNLTSTATIILLGMKLFNQLNALAGQYGNVSRLSGSLYPVSQVLYLNQDKNKKILKRKLLLS